MPLVNTDSSIEIMSRELRYNRRREVKRMASSTALETKTEVKSAVETLRDEAVEQNRRAKTADHYRDRKVAYQKKADAISTLVILGHAEVDSIEFKGGRPVVGLTLAGNVRLHAIPTELSVPARELVFRQVIARWNGCAGNK